MHLRYSTWLKHFKLSDIPLDEITFKFSKSSGPGGQHVNKVNTKVDLRLNIQNAQWIPTEIKKKLIEQNRTRITKEGDIFIDCDKFRNQESNKNECLQKLLKILQEASKIPKETSPEQKSHVKLLEKSYERNVAHMKQKRSETKKERRPISFDRD